MIFYERVQRKIGGAIIFSIHRDCACIIFLLFLFPFICPASTLYSANCHTASNRRSGHKKFAEDLWLPIYLFLQHFRRCRLIAFRRVRCLWPDRDLLFVTIIRGVYSFWDWGSRPSSQQDFSCRTMSRGFSLFCWLENLIFGQDRRDFAGPNAEPSLFSTIQLIYNVQLMVQPAIDWGSDSLDQQ